MIPFPLHLQYVKKHRIPELITLCERAQYWQYTERSITDNMKCTTLPPHSFQSFPGPCQTLDGRWLNEERWWRETAAAEAASRWRTQPWSVGSQVTMWMKCLFVFFLYEYGSISQLISLSLLYLGWFLKLSESGFTHWTSSWCFVNGYVAGLEFITCQDVAFTNYWGIPAFFSWFDHLCHCQRVPTQDVLLNRTLTWWQKW